MSIIKDYRDEPTNNLSADTPFFKVVLDMMKNQAWLLPIQKQALDSYLRFQKESAIADRFDVTNRIDR